MKKIMIFLAVLVLFCAVNESYARTVTLKATASGTYEKGVFTPTSDKYEAVYTIDEAGDRVILDKVMTSTREGRTQEGMTYDINNDTEGRGLSDFQVSRQKKGQNIVTASQDVDVMSTEVIIIGDDFYEFCRASNGKFYLESGVVSGETK